MCYFLRVLADEERRIAQFRRGSVDDSNSDAANSDAAEDSNTDSSRSGRSGSEADSDSRPRCRARQKKEADLIKDARELFCWQGEQKQLAITL